MKTYKDILLSKDFVWDENEELWKKNMGFGRKITVDVMFKNLFVITSNNLKIHDNFISTFKEFKEIMDKL